MKARLSLLMLTALSVTTCMPRDTLAPPGGDPVLNFPDILPQQDVYSLQSFSGMDSRRGRIITDSAALRAAWDTVFAKYAVGQKPFPPNIDFRLNVILIASAGETPTQLEWFRITMVRERPEHLAVLVESQWPRCGGAPVVTNPVHIVSVPRKATQATFEFVNITEPCS